MLLRKYFETGTCLGLLALLLLLLVPLQTAAPVENPLTAASEWTFMVYMDGDNNLEGAGVEDLNEMEFAQKFSTDEVNVVVQFDRINGYDTSNGDWTGTKRFLVEKDLDEQTISTEPVLDIGEANMGDPDTLVSFVDWSMKNYPAKKYALVLWDHGGAYHGICWDDSNTTSQGRADTINMTELKDALKRIKQLNGHRNLDLLGFDACLMAQIGVMAQVMDYVDVTVASGFVEPGDGWPYKRILEKLHSMAWMSKEELATVISQEYIESYSDRYDDPDDAFQTSMAAFNMSMFRNYLDIVNEFAVSLSKIAGTNYDEIWNARTAALSYDMAAVGPLTLTDYCMTDIWDFCLKIIDTAEFKFFKYELLRLAQEVINAQKEMTIESNAYPLIEENPTAKVAHGLTIYFPNDLDTTYDENFNELLFAREYFWDDFLIKWHQQKDVSNAQPTCIITYPRDVNESINQDLLFIPITGTAFDDEQIENIEIKIGENGDWQKVKFDPLKSTDWIYNLNVSDLPPGEHRIWVRAEDNEKSVKTVSTTFYVEEGVDWDVEQTDETFNFSYIVIAFIIVAAFLGIAKLIRDWKLKY